jgi:hypothetical protein
VKVLFVGEGPHEIGHSDTHPDLPRRAGGVLFALARRVSGGISEGSIALQWRDIVRFNPDARQRGLDRKVAAAVVLGSRRFDCDGTICVHDRDGDTDRLPQMQAGRERGLSLISESHRVVCAVAVESIEAWTLGAPTALAAHLQVDGSTIREACHANHVETFKETSEKIEKQPKRIVRKVAELGDQNDSTDFRILVAERTEVEELKRHCAIGFKPFAEELKAVFGGQLDDEEQDD